MASCSQALRSVGSSVTVTSAVLRGVAMVRVYTLASDHHTASAGQMETAECNV